MVLLVITTKKELLIGAPVEHVDHPHPLDRIAADLKRILQKRVTRDTPSDRKFESELKEGLKMVKSAKSEIRKVLLDE